MYSFLFSGELTNVKVVGFAFLAFNSNFEVIFTKVYSGDDAMNIFLDTILMHGFYYLNKNSENQIPLRQTPESLEKLKATRSCYICGCHATPSNQFVQHHCHYSRLINGEEIPGHEEGFAQSYPCNNCNLQLKPRRRIPVYGYNLAYNAKHILSNLSELGVNAVSIIPMKSSGSIGSIIINNNIQLIDMAYHFNNQVLHRIFQSVDNEDLFLLKLITNNSFETRPTLSHFPSRQFSIIT